MNESSEMLPIYPLTFRFQPNSGNLSGIPTCINPAFKVPQTVFQNTDHKQLYFGSYLGGCLIDICPLSLDSEFQIPRTVSA